MALVSLREIVQDAYQRQYAVGAFNVVNLDFLEAIVNAAEEKQSPVILNIAEVHFPFVTVEHIVPAIKAVCEKSKIPFALNLDHGLTFEAIMRAVRNGFTSVMFDGSHLSFEENIRQTQKVVEICHAVGVSVEGELGAIGGEEGGGLIGEANPDLFTNPDLAAQYVEQTGIDALAVGIGNVHGKYKGAPNLDFARLGQIRELVKIPLVLHGGSGISTPDFQRAIGMGISKINFFTGMSQVALETTASSLQKTGTKYNDYPLMLNEIKGGITKVVGEQMDIFMSTNKA
ncbi:ketose 1,6-bisphosphate aldolase [Persicobacter psychrovividus]|uniref:Fructose-bisphosphate aldolase n=1 Tax=Persicobacter psychrovividus TaxID=387638 RepID=A0ABN6LDN6_9BACT|nr:hypothetical protein PEPS_35300 [Persicobacter psychrovividus]